MSKSLSSFTAVEGIEGVFTAQSGTLRCSAIRLKSGGLCLYSPVAGLGDEARKSLADLGDVTVLLAPNHYHNKGIAEYVQAFPAARLCCSGAAMARLEKITGLELASLEDLEADMQPGMEVLSPEGLKTGEVWIRVRSADHLAWILTDALSGPKGPIGSYADEVQMLGTFPKYGVGDQDTYCRWLNETIAAEPPTLIIPCHGSMVRSPNLAQDMTKLVKHCI